MSYILEALKKSQQERELGHVPTLESPAFSAEGLSARSNPWILVAVFLAALAVVIALYSALRGGPQAPETLEVVARTSPPNPTKVQRDPATPEQAPGSLVAAAPEDVAPVAEQPAALPPPVQEPAYIEEDESDLVMEAPAAALAPAPRRREPTRPVAPAPPAPVRRQESKVPDDLIADIEAFKQEVRSAQSGKNQSKKTEQIKENKIAPQDLRLPKELRERLPQFIMSAHIYDKEPSKRFVLINGLKTREGEESREEITVVEILPDGAVLSFDGNRFYQRR